MKKKKNNSKNSSVFLDLDLDEEVDTELEEDIAQSIDIVNRNREELDNQREARINNKFQRNANGKIIEREKVKYQINFKIIIVVLAILIAIICFLYNYGVIFGIKFNSNSEVLIDENKIELVTKDSDLYGMYNEKLYVFSNNTLTLYNNKGKSEWSHDFSESFSPSIYVNGKYMLITNNSTGTMYLFEGKNEILNQKIDGEIKSAFLDKFGNMAIVYSTPSGYNNTVGVYEKNGTSLYDVHLENENIVSIEMLNNAQKLVICEAMTDSSKIGVRFRIVDIEQNEENQIRDVVTLDNQFVYDFKVQGKNIYALLDNKIVSIEMDSGNIVTLKEFDSTQMMFVALNKNYYTYLERNIKENKYVIENVNYNGNVISTTNIDSVPKNMVSGEYVNYYIFQDHVYMLNKWGIELGSKDTNFTPKYSIIFNNNKSLALVYTNKIYIVNL